MNPEDLASEITDLIIDADETFAKSANSYQQSIFRLVERLLYSDDEKYKLSLTKSGLIKPTASNIKIIQRIIAEVESSLITNPLKNAVDNYLKIFDRVQRLNNTYYGEQFSQFNPSPVFDDLKQAAKDLASTTMIDTAVKEGMLKPITNILDSATAAGGQSRRDLIDQLNTAITNNPNRLGRYASYTSRIVTDSLQQFSRSYSEAVTGFVEPDDRFYYYSKGTVKDTREFCKERNGKYYHQKEIQSWANQEWQGKIPATNKGNIFVLLGGYNCLHQLILVSRSIVPSASLGRMRREGYID